ncbi:flagellar hook-length control protein FliK [Catenovulum agarivorans]|uniref:flagellar hook-length control protein FliK n=1 Tax=Catenovulum agarivorans TaxID=1172192 RepID=UPI0002EF4CAC|nr:flagellar hook-length control protein FliK [Catenovulum agarivorans]
MQYIANIQPNIAASTPVSKNNTVDALLDSKSNYSDEAKFSHYLAEGAQQDSDNKPTAKSTNVAENQPTTVQTANKSTTQQQKNGAQEQSSTQAKESSSETAQATKNGDKTTETNPELNKTAKAVNDAINENQPEVESTNSDTEESSAFDLLSFLNQSNKAKTDIDKAASEKKSNQLDKENSLLQNSKQGKKATESTKDEKQLLLDEVAKSAPEDKELVDEAKAADTTTSAKPTNKVVSDKAAASDVVKVASKKQLTEGENEQASAKDSAKAKVTSTAVEGLKAIESSSVVKHTSSTKEDKKSQAQTGIPNVNQSLSNQDTQVEDKTKSAEHKTTSKLVENASEAKAANSNASTVKDSVVINPVDANKQQSKVQAKLAQTEATTEVTKAATEQAAKAHASADNNAPQADNLVKIQANKQQLDKTANNLNASKEAKAAELANEDKDQQLPQNQQINHTKSAETKLTSSSEKSEQKAANTDKSAESSGKSVELVGKSAVEGLNQPTEAVLAANDQTQGSSEQTAEQPDKKQAPVAKATATNSSNKEKLLEQVVSKEAKVTEDGQIKPDDIVNKESSAQVFEAQTIAAQVQSQQSSERMQESHKQQNIQQVTNKQEIQQAERTAKNQQQIVQLKEQVQLHKPEAATALNDAVRFMMNGRVQAAELRLDPPELGSMQIKISLNGDAASVSMLVQNPQAKEMLDQSVPRLREMLEQQGIELSDSQVEHQQANSGQGSDKNAQGGQRQGDGDNAEQDDTTQVIEQKIHNGHLGAVDYYA